MSAGLEYMFMKELYEDVQKAAKAGEQDQLKSACKAFWVAYNSVNLGVESFMREILVWANTVRSIEGNGLYR